VISSVWASLGFLLVYAAITVGHIRIRAKTGARESILVAAVVVNLALDRRTGRS